MKSEQTNMTPLGAVARGVVAGAVGTAAMTAWQKLSARLQQSSPEDPDADSQGSDPWESAPAPAQVAKRLIEGLFQREVGADKIPMLTHVTHWGYGTVWGAVYGLVHGSIGGRPLRQGVVFGTGVWALSYVELVPMGLYEPPWRYPPRELALDLSYHLVYGAGVATAYASMDGRET